MAVMQPTRPALPFPALPLGAHVPCLAPRPPPPPFAINETLHLLHGVSMQSYSVQVSVPC